MIPSIFNPAKCSENHAETALRLGEKGYSCSEAVICAFSESLGLPEHLAIRIASGFGGGMGLMGETCGAVTAAFMVIGLRFGTNDLAQSYHRQNTYLKVAEFAERFKKVKLSLNCRELCVGHSMSTPESAKALRQSGKPQEMIKTATRILEDLLLDGD